NAAELLALTPDVIVANGSPEVSALRQTTRTVPIVFANAADPVGQGFVASLSRPGGTVTGFTPLDEFGQSGKWLELLKEIAPQVRRAAILLNRAFAAGIAQLRDPSCRPVVGRGGKPDAVVELAGLTSAATRAAPGKFDRRPSGIRWSRSRPR